MNFSAELFTPDLTQAIGWTLLHSLWQGALIAIVLGLVLVVLSKYAANIRYWIAVNAMFLLLLTSVSTFIYLYERSAPNDIGITTPIYALEGSLQPDQISNKQMADEVASNTRNHPIDYFSYAESHLPLFVTIWLLGICLLGLKMLGELAYLQHLKNYRCQLLPDHWQSRIQEISKTMGVRKKVKLIESFRLHSPMVIGFFKPVILFPIGMINQLSTDQIESIIAHELAHIRRNDYLVNILLSIVEIVLFFNPMVWWISKRIKAEREFSCDDAALHFTGNPLVYIKSLAKMEEWRLGNSRPLAMSFYSSKGGVLSRAQRIIKMNYHQETPTKTLMSFGILGVCITLLAFQPAATRDSIPLVEASIQTETITSDAITVAEQETTDLITDFSVEETKSIDANPEEEPLHPIETLTVPLVTSLDSLPEGLKALQEELNKMEKEHSKLERLRDGEERVMREKALQIEQEQFEKGQTQRALIYALETEMRNVQMEHENMNYELERKQRELQKEELQLEKIRNEQEYEEEQIEQKEDMSSEVRSKQRRAMLEKEKSLRQQAMKLREKEIMLEKERHEKMFALEAKVREIEKRHFTKVQEMELAANAFEIKEQELEYALELKEAELEAKIELIEENMHRLVEKMHGLEKESRLGEQ